MITKFEKFNEGINHLLVGPTKEEVWNKIGLDFFGLKTPPPSVEEFIDYIFENGNSDTTESSDICRWKFNNRCIFFIMKRMFSIHIYERFYIILDLFYNIQHYRVILQLIQPKLKEKFGDFIINPTRVMTLED